MYADRREEERVGLLKNSRRKKKRKTFFFLGVTEYRTGYILESKWVGREARESVELNREKKRKERKNLPSIGGEDPLLCVVL